MATITEEELLKQFNDEQALVYLTHKGKPGLEEEMQQVLNIKLYRQFTAYMEHNKHEVMAEENNEADEEPEQVTVEIAFKSPMKGVSETSPEIQAICKELEADIVIDQGIDLTLVVITAPTEKACFDAQVKFWNAIAKHQKAIDCNYEAHLLETWSTFTEEQQLDFQNDTNVRFSKIADEDACLLLSAFREEHLTAALDKLRKSVGEAAASYDEAVSVTTVEYNGYQDNDLTLNEEPTETRKDGVCFTVGGEIHLKMTLEANVVGLLIGKQGATIKWIQEHFGVIASVHGQDNKTFVHLKAPDMDSMILAQKDVLKILRLKQKVKDTFYDDAVCDAWEQIAEKEQLELQHQTNVNVKLVENGTDKYLLLRAFNQEQLEDAKVKLYEFIVERPDWFKPEKEDDDDESDDTASNTEAVTPTTAAPRVLPVIPKIKDKATDTSDLDITEWLRETLRLAEENLHGKDTVSNVTEVLRELPSLLNTINELKQKLEHLTPKASVPKEVKIHITEVQEIKDNGSVTEEIKPGNLHFPEEEPSLNRCNVLDRVKLYERILTP